MSADVDVVALLDRLVRIDSVNPSLDERGTGEAAVARVLMDEIGAIGLDATAHEARPGRPNVVAILPGTADGPRLLLEAHMDTVPQPPEPIPVAVAGDRLTGRGACDTKASCAAMLAAMARLAGEDAPRPTVVFAAVADEESRMSGARALLEQALPMDVAVVGEPTSLQPIRVHNGVVRLTLIAEGDAAHTSKAHLGVNAITAASRAVAVLDEELLPRIRERAHPLAGPALLTAATVHGGTAVNVVPDRCEVRYDRRLAPGETPEAAVAEIEAVLSAMRSNGHRVRLDEPTLVLPAVETAADHPLVRAAETTVTRMVGERVVAEGAPYCTDACVLSGTGGLPFIVLGPGSIDQAHTPDEWVSIAEVRRAVDVYTAIAHALADGSTSDAETKGPGT